MPFSETLYCLISDFRLDQLVPIWYTFPSTMPSILVGAVFTSPTCRPTGDGGPNSGCPPLTSSAIQQKINSPSVNSFCVDTIALCYPAICRTTVIISMFEHLSSTIPANGISVSSLLLLPSRAISVSPFVCADPMASCVWLLVSPALGAGSSSAHMKCRRSILGS